MYHPLAPALVSAFSLPASQLGGTHTALRTYCCRQPTSAAAHPVKEAAARRIAAEQPEPAERTTAKTPSPRAPHREAEQRATSLTPQKSGPDVTTLGELQPMCCSPRLFAHWDAARRAAQGCPERAGGSAAGSRRRSLTWQITRWSCRPA